jgi:hypothetical protein
MEDLNTTYASLLTNGSVLVRRVRHLPRWALYCGSWLQRRHKAHRSLPAGYGLPAARGCDRNGCVDDADLLRLLFEFGGRGYRNEDLNWDGTVDDADLLEVLFNFGSGC